MVLVVGVEGGGGGGGERKEPSVSVCVRARGCSRWSLLSQRVALRPSPVAVCEGGREPGSLSSLSLSLSPSLSLSLPSLSLSSQSLLSPLSVSPPPFSLSVCVCACVRLLGEGSGRERRRRRWEAGGGGGGGGGRRRGEEDAGTRTPTDDWLQITRGTRGARGPALPFTNPLLAGGATFPGSPAARPSSSRLALRLSRPAQRAVDYFLLLSEIIVWKGWKEGVSATLSLTLRVWGVCVCVHVRVCV